MQQSDSEVQNVAFLQMLYTHFTICYFPRYKTLQSNAQVNLKTLTKLNNTTICHTYCFLCKQQTYGEICTKILFPRES